MSKWLRKDDYEMFADQKAKEAENQPEQSGGGFYKKWNNPKMGTVEKAKEYKIRLLPDPVKGFFKEYLYHGFMSGEKFKYFLCPKTHGLDEYCPFCEANKILYQGNESDKKKAGDYRRKNRFVSNIYVIDDPRDAEVKDDNYKVNGTVRLYEFPGTVESKITNEVTDKENGYGHAIFDPEDGYDFILKIKAKPKDKFGKEWPDYGDTMFARRSSPITEGEEAIGKIMEQRVELTKYIDSLALSVDDMEALLKAEMLWEDVGHTFERHYRREMPADTTPRQEATRETPARQEATQTTPTTTQATQETTNEDVDDTDALLEELQNM